METKYLLHLQVSRYAVLTVLATECSELERPSTWFGSLGGVQTRAVSGRSLVLGSNSLSALHSPCSRTGLARRDYSEKREERREQPGEGRRDAQAGSREAGPSVSVRRPICSAIV